MAAKAKKPVSSAGSEKKVERVKSGISGLDKILKGGLPKGSVVLITGGAGTGKTTFLSQFLWEGLQEGEKCLYITLEETPEDIINDAVLYGWDFAPYRKSGMFRIDFFDPFELGDVNARLKDMIAVNKFTRVVIDSTSLFGMYLNDEYKIRKKLFKLAQDLKGAKCTALISAEIPEDSKALSRYGVEEFVVDGVIVLYYLGLGEGVFRNLAVRKMRRTDHLHGAFPLEMTNKGIKVVVGSGIL